MFTKQELKDIRDTYYSYLDGCVEPKYFDRDYLQLPPLCFDDDGFIKITKSIVVKTSIELLKIIEKENSNNKQR
jgi:hypothetical protein